MTSRRAVRRTRAEARDERCVLAIIEVPGDAEHCFEIRCETHDFWSHTSSGYEAAEFAALRHAIGMGQTLNRKDIR
jgi:hypothetical protein